MSAARQLEWRKAVRDSDLGTAAKTVALVLDTFMDRRGFAWPSRERIARGASVSVDTVDRALRRLEDAELLLIVRSRGRVSNRYQAALPTAASQTRLEESQQPQVGGPTAALVPPQQPHQRYPKPPKKPPIEKPPVSAEEEEADAKQKTANPPGDLRELDRRLAALEKSAGRIDGPGRDEITSAWFEDSAGVAALIEKYADLARNGSVRSGGGALVAAVRRGGHLGAAELAPSLLPCPECGLGAGRHLDGCPLAEASA